MTIQNPNQFAASGRNRPQDWLLAIVAIWLFISPWVLGFSGAVAGDAAAGAAVAASRASWNAWILGVVLFVIAVAQARTFTPARFQEKWLDVILGIWIFVAPWALGFVSLPSASWSHWVVGAVVFIIGATKYGKAQDVPLASEPGLPRMSDPTVSPLADEPGAVPPRPTAGNVNTAGERRRAGSQR
jgi:hypothetical protein